MTEQPRPSLKQAADEHDITIAFTPGQLLLLAVGLWALLRFIRGLRGH